jgi:hypothetical protein
VNVDGDLLEILISKPLHPGIALWLILCCGVQVMNGLKVSLCSTERAPGLHAPANSSRHPAEAKRWQLKI